MCLMKSFDSVFHSDAIQFWSAVLPLDVAKTIIQTAPDKSSTRNPFAVLNSVRRPVPLFLLISIALPNSNTRAMFSKL